MNGEWLIKIKPTIPLQLTINYTIIFKIIKLQANLVKLISRHERIL